MLADPCSRSKVWEALDREIRKPGENRGQIVGAGSFNRRQLSTTERIRRNLGPRLWTADMYPVLPAQSHGIHRNSPQGYCSAQVPDVFVRTTEGETLLHPRYRHPAIAQGRPVLYAGEAQFDNRKLRWWSNGSGNYSPDPGHATQAGLPMDQFYSYEDILRGVHTRAKDEKSATLQAKMFASRSHLPGLHYTLFFRNRVG